MRHALTRREILGLIGASGAVSLAHFGGASRAWAATCAVTPEATEGPYWVDEMLNRSDIRSDPTTGTVRPGIPLELRLNVLRADGACAGADGVQVDVWHCDAGGLYSDESANGTVGQKFLRGYQLTDASGAVSFTTIYPGWYAGRTVHIHYRVRAFDGDSTVYDHVSQLFFDDTLTDQVFTQSPYASRGSRSTRNSNDNIYFADGLLAVSADGGGGYVATFDVGLDALPASTGTTTTVPGGSTTTTTLAGGDCASAATFAALSCRTTALRTAVVADLDDGTRRRRLLHVIDERVQTNLTRAEALAASGKSRGARARLRVARRGVKTIQRILGRTSVDDADVAGLDASAAALATQMDDLRQTL